MAVKQTAGRDALGEFAPKFAELNDDVLFGQVWSREDKLSLRDRSLVTVVALMAQGLTDESFRYHLLSQGDLDGGGCQMILQETYTLANGIAIPKLGLGTWFIDNNKAAQAVRALHHLIVRRFCAHYAHTVIYISRLKVGGRQLGACALIIYFHA